ncbi:MAG: hypothetical protein K2K57_02865 [Oscillospiraceae bacterium]|nr:hypothetical protein [Oscillospiraceae bacterium]
MGMFDFHITIVFDGARISSENSLWKIAGNTEIPEKDIHVILSESRGIKRIKDNFYKSKSDAEIYLHNNDLSEVVGIEIKGMLGNIDKNSEEIFKIISRLKECYSFKTFIQSEVCETGSGEELSEKIKTIYRETYLIYQKSLKIHGRRKL